MKVFHAAAERVGDISGYTLQLSGTISDSLVSSTVQLFNTREPTDKHLLHTSATTTSLGTIFFPCTTTSIWLLPVQNEYRRLMTITQWTFPVYASGFCNALCMDTDIPGHSGELYTLLERVIALSVKMFPPVHSASSVSSNSMNICDSNDCQQDTTVSSSSMIQCTIEENVVAQAAASERVCAPSVNSAAHHKSHHIKDSNNNSSSSNASDSRSSSDDESSHSSSGSSSNDDGSSSSSDTISNSRNIAVFSPRQPVTTETMCGLINPRSRCYLNVILQCLRSFTSITAACVRANTTITAMKDEREKLSLELLPAYLDLLTIMEEPPILNQLEAPCVDAALVEKILHKYIKAFKHKAHKSKSQHDAKEALSTLVEMMQLATNSVHNEDLETTYEYQYENSIEWNAQNLWNYYFSRKQSALTTTFHYVESTTRICESCQFEQRDLFVKSGYDHVVLVTHRTIPVTVVLSVHNINELIAHLDADPNADRDASYLLATIQASTLIRSTSFLADEHTDFPILEQHCRQQLDADIMEGKSFIFAKARDDGKTFGGMLHCKQGFAVWDCPAIFAYVVDEPEDQHYFVMQQSLQKVSFVAPVFF